MSIGEAAVRSWLRYDVLLTTYSESCGPARSTRAPFVELRRDDVEHSRSTSNNLAKRS